MAIKVVDLMIAPQCADSFDCDQPEPSPAEAMLRLARDGDLRRIMGAAAKERYLKLFSPRVVVPLMVEAYRRETRNGHGVAGNRRREWTPSTVGRCLQPSAGKFQVWKS